MNSRDKILAAILDCKLPLAPLPPTIVLKREVADNAGRFKEVLKSIGGSVIEIGEKREINIFIRNNYTAANQIFSTIDEVGINSHPAEYNNMPHTLQGIDLAVIEAHFGVAENGAVWVTEDQIPERVLPFICQHLAVVIKAKNIVQTMEEAYVEIGQKRFGFGTFIAGPSKTADIEQSLVLGAHGPKSMVVFLLVE